MRIAGYIALSLFLLTGCGNGKQGERAGTSVVFIFPADVGSDTLEVYAADTEAEKRMRALGLLDIREVDPSLEVCLMYATAENFLRKPLYRDIRKAFALPETALRLADAQRRLKEVRPDLHLLIYDAARPMWVQQEMWDRVKGTENRVYVSNPRHGGGLHNYGAAVDLTLADSLGNALPMGCEFDYFGEEARPDREEDLLKQGRLSLEHFSNRRLLRKVMVEAGFQVLPGEWWHFNLMSREEARRRMKEEGLKRID